MTHYSFKKSTPENIQRMREMYKNGTNFVDIAEFFGIHYSSVMYWMGRLKRKPKDFETIKNLINERKIMEDEKINKGKSYNKYAEEVVKKKLLEESEKKVAEIKSESEKKRLENNRKIKERLYKIHEK